VKVSWTLIVWGSSTLTLAPILMLYGAKCTHMCVLANRLSLVTAVVLQANTFVAETSGVSSDSSPSRRRMNF
jgi:hypothetical protein